jgi:aminomuconate-semialdehyde/2-hydroxymuconate-6-semialdehyde dehydrogenase
VRSIFRSQGQSCVAGARLLVEKSIAEPFVELVLKETAKLIIGDPLDEKTEYGPLVSASHRARVADFVDRAAREGAQILCGGEPLPREGFYYAPTVLDNVSPSSAVACEEVFGPVLTVERFEDEAQAIAIANASRYGLAAYLWTNGLERALRVAERLKTGMVWLNSFFLRDLRTPFGGTRESGIGRQGGRYSLELWTEPKLICMTYGGE